VPLRLAALPGHDARFQAAMSGRSGLAIERVAETGSTNSDLLARVHALARPAAAAFEPCVLVAERQHAGRGRHGRAWHSTPGASLTFSMAWPFARADLSGLSLAVGAVLADSLEAPGCTRIGLKWPNDLWLLDADAGAEGRPGRKLAGVLIETAPLAAGRVAVIGIGLNVRAQAIDDAASGVASWAEIAPAATPASALARVIAPLADALGRFERDGFAAFAERFAARDLLRGRRVVGLGADGAVEGLGGGVSAAGELLLQTGRGLQRVSSGEVRLQLGVAATAGRIDRQRAGSTC
jgi:BirA family biotin operon repressor/biotin-[acetyl-CoA-carboxylase] ligase